MRLLDFPTTSQERIQSNIDRFHKLFMGQDGDMDTVYELLDVIQEYLMDYDDEYLSQAFVKIQEANFYIYAYCEE